MVTRVTSLGRQSEKRAAIEAGVLRATEELLEEGASFAELGIERIAKRAGISRTAFYFYFRDKRELLVRLTEGVTEELYAQADAWWSGEGTGTEELERALEAIAVLYGEHFALLRAIVEVATYDEGIATFWRALLGRFVDATDERISAEQAAGRADAAIPARATAFSLVWMTERTLYEQHVQASPFATGEVVAALGRIWIRALT
jgi:TetR/AcrR family transcriptional regulator, ethionamide resistance regulator